MTRQSGFTLLELVIALAIFSLLSLGSWRLYEGLLRVQEQVSAHEQALRSLQRALSVLERDLMQLAVSTEAPALRLRQGELSLLRGNWRNPLDQPRSERQEVSYRLEAHSLWRHSRSPGLAPPLQQVLLGDVRQWRWRFHDPRVGWRSDWPAGAKLPRAIEVTLSAGRFDGIRRVILLPEDA
ncbi:type II secretion system minor pseudopilin GspJ [Pseudomonas asplenii]|uniref:type II secretion system minor pseudopilin GspJ n=1 Tax=Pseudomonas asplenii TaxID=53407 RepID=UPI00035FF480|nr:type II secretion system minor pseudopilin GspJ [Pseudomonas fuscovaginae]